MCDTSNTQAPLCDVRVFLLSSIIWIHVASNYILHALSICRNIFQCFLLDAIISPIWSYLCGMVLWTSRFFCCNLLVIFLSLITCSSTFVAELLRSFAFAITFLDMAPWKGDERLTLVTRSSRFILTLDPRVWSSHVEQSSSYRTHPYFLWKVSTTCKCASWA